MVFGWRAPCPPRVVFVLGFVSSINKFSHFRQKVWFDAQRTKRGRACSRSRIPVSRALLSSVICMFCITVVHVMKNKTNRGYAPQSGSEKQLGG